MPEEITDKPTYIKRHDTFDDLELAIDLCLNVNELRELYKLNMHHESETMKLLFTTKKDTL
jgi:hypothetical protein